jgi:hypothetical protein
VYHDLIHTPLRHPTWRLAWSRLNEHDARQGREPE